MVRSAIAFGAILLVIWVWVISQSSSTSSTPYTTEERARVDSLRKVLNKDALPIAAEDEPNLFSNAFPVFVLLGGSLLVLWWWFGRKSPELQGGFAKTLAVQEVQPGYSIAVVEMLDELWIMGMAGNSMELLEKRPLEDKTRFINEGSGEPQSFSSVLKSIRGGAS